MNTLWHREELLPPQERFNAGQKLFYWLMLYEALLLLLSGFFLWVPEYIPRQEAWARGGDTGVFFVSGSITAILTGYVSRTWAKAHHRLWYHRVTGEAPSKG